MRNDGQLNRPLNNVVIGISNVVLAHGRGVHSAIYDNLHVAHIENKTIASADVDHVEPKGGAFS
jgi:hypothetical protein